LRLDVQTQFLNGCFEPVVGGDLLCLARLNGFQAGEDCIGEQLGEGKQGIVHRQIVITNERSRMITDGLALVMRVDDVTEL